MVSFSRCEKLIAASTANAGRGSARGAVCVESEGVIAPRTFPVAGRSLTIGVDVEDATVPAHPFRLDFQPLRIAVPMTVSRHLGARRDHPFFEAGFHRLRWRRENRIPDLIPRPNLHRRVR